MQQIYLGGMYHNDASHDHFAMDSYNIICWMYFSTYDLGYCRPLQCAKFVTPLVQRTTITQIESGKGHPTYVILRNHGEVII